MLRRSESQRELKLQSFLTTTLKELIMSIYSNIVKKYEHLLSKRRDHSLLNQILDRPSVLKNIAPSYGFFGGVKLEPLIIKVEDYITHISLEVKEENTYLNFKGLRLIDANGQIIEFDEDVVLSFSSNIRSEQYARDFNNGVGFHSKLEDCPKLTLTFPDAKYVSRIEVINRADKCGIRSRMLSVSVTSANNSDSVELYHAYSDECIESFVNSLCKVTNLRSLNDVESEELRYKLLKRALEKMREPNFKVEDDYFKFVLQLLSTWSEEKPLPAVHRIELEILSFYIFCKTKSNIGVTLAPFSTILSDSESLDILEEEINNLRLNSNLSQIQLTKHGISHQGILSKNISKALETIRIVIDDLADMGLRPCLAYGTLLGAVREQAFISHDDDVDLLVEFPQEDINFEKAFLLTEALLKKFDKDKYRTDLEVRHGNNLNIHVMLKETNFVLDIFPYWNSDGMSHLHMQNMKVREIPAEILRDRSSVDLYGYKFPAPGQPEQFLYERYGESWHISDKYHEWPWRLN